MPPVSPDEAPYDLPKNWSWMKLGNLGETQTGTTPPSQQIENFGNFIPFIGPGDINKFYINYNNKGLSETGLSKGRLIKNNSILMVCIGGSIGKCAINSIDVTCNQQINTLTPYITETLKYIFYSVISPYFQLFIVEMAGGSATPIINKQKWSNIFIPLPPLAEQTRIVAKVDQLMALCDSLETKLAQAGTSSETLITASIRNLIAA
ncbi:MAG: restriction endonuclease subunit S [Desulfobacteraceae bacterium]|nr:restriction endonuclease subunit S [Desulfobacteraceae bacterium]